MNPRINISYDIEENGATIKKSLPFSVGIIGDFCGNNSPYAKLDFNEREFVPIAASSFSAVMEQLGPATAFTIESILNPEKTLHISLSFTTMDNFKPEKIIKQVPELNRLLELRSEIKEIQLNPDEIPAEILEAIAVNYKDIINEL
jgi:type VI secretion system protein ImpB